MKELYAPITLDLTKSNEYKVIYANQGDSGTRKLVVHLTENSEDYIMEDNIIARLTGQRPDGEPILKDCVINYPENCIEYVFEEDVLALSGIAEDKISIYTNATLTDKEKAFQLLSSVDFKIQIEPSPFPEKKLMQSPVFTSLANALHRLDASVDESIELSSNLAELQTNLTILKDETSTAKLHAEQATNVIVSTNNTITTAESLRNNAEIIRETAEVARQQNTAAAIQNTVSAMEQVTSALTNVNTAAADAAAKASLAHDATVNATSATASATQKINEVTTLSTNVFNAEAVRVTAEAARDNAEVTRISTEAARVTAELNRGSAETKRESAETTRQQNTVSALQKADTATQRANTAASACEGIVTGTGLISSSEKGSIDGVATLDNNGKIPKVQLLDSFAETSDFIATIGTAWLGATAPYTQSIALAGILESDTPTVDVVLSSVLETALLQEKAWNCISRIVTTNGSLTVSCNKKKPTTEIPIQLKVVR